MTTATAVHPGHEPSRETRGDRSIDLAWDLGEREVDGETVRLAVVLGCSHDVNRKQFYATLSLREDKGDGAWSYRPFDSVTVCRERVARYSDGRLLAFSSTARNCLLAHASDPRVQAKFAGRHEMPDVSALT